MGQDLLPAFCELSQLLQHSPLRLWDYLREPAAGANRLSLYAGWHASTCSGLAWYGFPSEWVGLHSRRAFIGTNLPRYLQKGAASILAICSVVEVVISEPTTIRPEPNARGIIGAAWAKCCSRLPTHLAHPLENELAVVIHALGTSLQGS